MGGRPSPRSRRLPLRCRPPAIRCAVGRGHRRPRGGPPLGDGRPGHQPIDEPSGRHPRTGRRRHRRGVAGSPRHADVDLSAPPPPGARRRDGAGDRGAGRLARRMPGPRYLWGNDHRSPLGGHRPRRGRSPTRGGVRGTRARGGGRGPVAVVAARGRPRRRGVSRGVRRRLRPPRHRAAPPPPRWRPRRPLRRRRRPRAGGRPRRRAAPTVRRPASRARPGPAPAG